MSKPICSRLSSRWRTHDTRESHIRVRQLVDECLTEREADIIRQRYGLGGKPPRTQRELAAEYGISRSYV